MNWTVDFSDGVSTSSPVCRSSRVLLPVFEDTATSRRLWWSMIVTRDDIDHWPLVAVGPLIHRVPLIMLTHYPADSFCAQNSPVVWSYNATVPNNCTHAIGRKHLCIITSSLWIFAMMTIWPSDCGDTSYTEVSEAWYKAPYVRAVGVCGSSLSPP